MEQKSRPDQEDQRQADFTHDQSAAQPVAARGRAARRILQGKAEIGPRSLERRDEANDGTGQQRDAQRRTEDRRIHRDHVSASEAHGGHQAAQSPRGTEGEGPAEEATDEGEQDALRQHLPDDARAAGAQCRPEGDLLFAARSPGEEQVRDIGAGDQQQQPDGPEQDAASVGLIARVSCSSIRANDAVQSFLNEG